MLRISGITRKLAAALLALVLVMGMLPMAAQAAETPPDWYFLFAIFKNVDTDCADKNGTKTHTKYTMTQDEIDLVRDNAKEFEEYMNNVGVMCAHTEVVEIDAPVTELVPSRASYGSYFSTELVAPFLAGKVDLDKYDHVFAVVSLNVSVGYLGMTGSAFENGTGCSCVNLRNRKYALETIDSFTHQPESVYAHEFLHFMEDLNGKWGKEFALDKIVENHYKGDYSDVDCLTDVILNRAKGNAGTGVVPNVWQYPPRVFRTIREFAIPDGAATVGASAFYHCGNLESVTIPSSVAKIGDYAFYDCVSLESVSIPQDVTNIGYAAFWNTGLKNVYYSGSESQWNKISFGEFNDTLTKATIHYNSTMPGTSNTSDTLNTSGTSTTSGTSAASGTTTTSNTPAFTDVAASSPFAPAISWAVEKNITTGKTSTTFAPGENCSNGQILTFLWRANGSPEPTIGNPFRDTIPNSFQKAAVWAYEKGLVSGSTFGSDTPCTRSTVVTYLWKLAGSPAASQSTSFSDVSANANYAQAVAWAVKNGVTSGMGNGTFAPSAVCTRGQIVTFLYRAFA